MHIDEEVRTKAETLFNTSTHSMGDTLGIEFLWLSKTKVQASMPVNDNTIQPFGILHGGASVALAETVASVGAWFNTDENHEAVGLEINANHIKAVPKGDTVTATAIPLHRGRKIQVWEITVRNKNKKLVCSSRCTLMVVNR